MLEQMTTIEYVLTHIDDFLWSNSLFLLDEKWTLYTKGIVWDGDDVETDQDEIPKIAKENHLPYSIGIWQIEEIVDNANRQLPHPTAEELFQAFLFYCDNDAFICF